MTPHHHIPDDLLIGYATGTLTEAESLLIATHLSLCPVCRKHNRSLEAVGGAVLESITPVEMADSSLESLLAVLDDPFPPPAPRSVLPEAFADLLLPTPLRNYVVESGQKQWQTVVPGVVHQITLPVSLGGVPVRLTRMRGGFKVPKHTHNGRELNLVLHGGFHDRGEGFGPGDISDRDESVTHELNIDPGEPCILLAVNENPLVPVSITAKLASWFTPF